MTYKNALVKKIKYLTNTLLPILFWVLLTFGFDKPYVAVLTLCAALLHEIGHITAALIEDVDLTSLGGRLNGLRISIPTSSPYIKSALIILSGPLINIAVGLLFLAIGHRSFYFSLFGTINLLTALSNLLPVEGYDGYKLLLEIARARNSQKAALMLNSISTLLLITITLFSLYLLQRLGEGYWLFAVFFTSLITKTAGVNKKASKTENSRAKQSILEK